MSFHDDVERVLREEERKNRRTQTATTRRATRQFDQPTYFAILYAKMLIKFRRRKPEPTDPSPVTPATTRITYLSIMKEDLARFFARKKKSNTPKPKNRDSWDDWKEYFDDGAGGKV